MADNDFTSSSGITRDQDLAVVEFEPIFTLNQVNEFEANYNELWGVKRRCAMITLTRTKQELIDGFYRDNNLDTAISLVEHLMDYCDHLKAGIEITEAAIARLAIASGVVETSDIK